LNWKRSINLVKDEILGLDIGSSTVKIVALKKDDAGYSVTAIGIRDIAASEDDYNQHRINTVKAIRECFEQARIKTKMVVCGVSGPEVINGRYTRSGLTRSIAGLPVQCGR